jgi:GNAT superfamily N-acetyltransferase
MYIPRLGKPPGPMLESYDRVISQRAVYVVEEGGAVIGALVLGRDREGLLLENVAVDPQHLGKGIGEALLQFAEAEARRQGFAQIHLYTYARREENGFSRVYMRKVLA